MISLRKADRNDRHIIKKMMMKFRNEYANTGAKIMDVDTPIEVTKGDISKGLVYMILSGKDIVGCVDVEYRTDIFTGEIVSTGEFITNLYIKPEYRNRNIATTVRKLLEQHNVYGTNITAGRLVEKKDYWLEQGYTHYARDPREGRNDKHALIRITKDPSKTPDYYWTKL